MDAQQLVTAAREMIRRTGAPVTTENLNRAMLLLAQNNTAPTASDFDMNVDRLMQRSGAASAPRRQASVPRNAQPAAPVGQEAPAPAVAETPLPMPPMSNAEAAPEINAGRAELMQQDIAADRVPVQRAPVQATPDGGFVEMPNDSRMGSNRVVRDLGMLAESAGVVAGGTTLPGRVAGAVLPDVRLGINYTQLPGSTGRAAISGADDAGSLAGAGPVGGLPGGSGAAQALPAPARRISGPPSAPQAPPASAAPEVIPMGQSQASRTVEQIERQLLDAANRGDARAQEVLLGSLRGPVAQAATQAPRAATRSRGGPRGSQTRAEAARQRAARNGQE